MKLIEKAGILLAAGSACIVLGASASPAAAAGTDTLVLYLSEDAYQGDAQFIPLIDGQAIAAAQTVTVHNITGQSQAFAFTGTWGGGQQRVGVKFINHKTDGTSAGDGHARNIFVNAINYDGRFVLPGEEITGNEKKVFVTPYATTCVANTGRTTGNCSNVTATLGNMSLSLPVVYPTNILRMSSTWSAGGVADA